MDSPRISNRESSVRIPTGPAQSGVGAWTDVLVLLPRSARRDRGRRCREKAILADPVVRVLADVFANPGTPGRPCLSLLIHGRTDRDVLIDLLGRPGDRKPEGHPVNSRGVAGTSFPGWERRGHRLSDLLCDESNQKTIWLLRPLHRYLSESCASVFRLRFCPMAQADEQPIPLRHLAEPVRQSTGE